MLRENGPVGVYPPFLLCACPVKRYIHICQLYRFFGFRLGPFPLFPFLTAEVADVKEDSDEREYEAEDNKSLQNKKDKSLGVGVNCEEFVGQGEGDCY